MKLINRLALLKVHGNFKAKADFLVGWFSPHTDYSCDLVTVSNGLSAPWGQHKDSTRRTVLPQK